MSTPDTARDRLTRILARLIQRTEANDVAWEPAAFPDSFAINVAEVRFRTRSQMGNGRAPYVLEFLNFPFLPPFESGDPAYPDRDELLERLHDAARANALAHAPDILAAVEQQLGLSPTSASG